MKTNYIYATSQSGTDRLWFWPIILAAVALMILGATVPFAFAEEDDEEITFDEAAIYFELNNTDGDLGIHALIDGKPWKRLEIEDPNERRMLGVNVRGRLRRQGLTEFFFESAEPTFDELSPKRFFKRFPEGIYEIEGITLEGDELESEVWVSQVMPAPATISLTSEAGTILAAENCDVGLPEFDADDTIVISWDPVMTSHPFLGAEGSVVVHNYEVVVEIDETPWKMSIILSPDDNQFEIPPEILALAEFDDEGEAEVKFEVLVRAMNHNQTAVESCFVIAED
jgi:hypothetical protein